MKPIFSRPFTGGEKTTPFIWATGRGTDSKNGSWNLVCPGELWKVAHMYNTYTYVNIHLYIHISICIYIYIHTYIFIYTPYSFSVIYIYIHIYIFTYIYTCMYLNIYIYIYIGPIYFWRVYQMGAAMKPTTDLRGYQFWLFWPTSKNWQKKIPM